jgi:NNP family nitrate/nitrite transporter-like MFS transporter
MHYAITKSVSKKQPAPIKTIEKQQLVPVTN